MKKDTKLQKLAQSSIEKDFFKFETNFNDAMLFRIGEKLKDKDES